ncbi:MAG TPA: DUF5658 family protein [Symbiobacteriaceae bacterium]|nr:DUF5658 family protein [Symbiobacteriaceae bacterium]
MARLQMPVWLVAGLTLILAGNVLDLALTLWGLRAQVIREANPFLAPLLEGSPALGAALKLGVAVAGVAVLCWAYPRSPRLVAGAVAVVALATLAVLMLHAVWIGAFIQ